MLRAGQAAAAEDGRAHPEVASELLHEHVCGDLRGSEDRVKALVDRHRLIDAAGEWMRWIDLPARVPLDERQAVRRVSVHLVRGRENEHGLGRVTAGELEQRERRGRVDAEVE